MHEPHTKQAEARLTLLHTSAGSQQAPLKSSGHTPCPAADLDLALPEVGRGTSAETMH